MEEIKISVSKRGYGRDVYVLRVDGFIDTITAPELDRTLGTMVDQGKHNLIMDLGGVDYISSAGWGIFISRIKEIRRHGGDLKLARMSPGVYEVFELLEFDRILKAHDNLEGAEKDFGIEYSEEVPIATFRGSLEKQLDESSIDNMEKTVGVQSLVEPAEASEEPGAEGSLREEELSLEDKIREIVKAHPFWSSRKIRRELNTAKYGLVKLGWWRGWWILRRLGLNSRRKRMQHAKKP